MERRLPRNVADRLAREPGLRDVDRALVLHLIERGALHVDIASNAGDLAAAVGWSPSTIYASLKRLAAHDLVTHRRAGARHSLYHVQLGA